MNGTWMRYGLVVFALLSLPAARAGTAQRTPLSDADIRAQVESRLFDAGLVGVHVEVGRRTVTLSGSVESLWQKDQAVRQARKVHDVHEVVSALSITRGESDGALALEIAGDVSASSYFSIFDDVSVHVADGAATLTGYVTTPDKSREFATVTSKVPGVQRVVNQIETLPASMMDDDLRYAVAMAIYGNPMFAQYAIQHTPPIHIIVRRGQVTLTGVVLSEADRQAAGMFAHGAFGVMGVDNQLRLAEKSGPGT